MDAGVVKGYTCRDLRAADSAVFQCYVPRLGYTEPAYTLSVLEPPLLLAGELITVAASHTSVVVSYVPVQGATKYRVEWSVEGVGRWSTLETNATQVELQCGWSRAPSTGCGLYRGIVLGTWRSERTAEVSGPWSQDRCWAGLWGEWWGLLSWMSS